MAGSSSSGAASENRSVTSGTGGSSQASSSSRSAASSLTSKLPKWYKTSGNSGPKTQRHKISMYIKYALST